LKSILDPFNGIIKDLDVSTLIRAKRQLYELSGRKGRIGKFKPISFRRIETSGPNGPKSMYRIVEDACALLRNPRICGNLFIWYFLNGGKRYIITIIVLGLLGQVLFLKPLLLGRLGVVYNQAGKARVVAMTNYWIQIGLYPLHKGIFSFLKTLKTDGTFDQRAPVKELILKEIPEFHSYDLTAATDRLPIKLQESILSTYIGAFRASI
jgi:hypothetical protein